MTPPVLLVQLPGTRGSSIHLAPHPPLYGGDRWDARVPATVTTLCGMTGAADQVVVLTGVTGVPCDGCVVVGALAGGVVRPSALIGELRGYLVERDLAEAALDLLAARGTPAPALADDRDPGFLLVLTVTPFDGPLPWPGSVRAVATLPDLPVDDSGPVRWHQLPDSTRLAGDLDLCACLIAAAKRNLTTSHGDNETRHPSPTGAACHCRQVGAAAPPPAGGRS